MAETVGVEIEFAGDHRAVIAALRAAGLTRETRLHNYMGHDNHQWIVKDDASVRGGAELVSPPLDFNDPAQRAQITTAVKCLQEAGATTNRTGGIHVHVGSADLSPVQVAAVAKLFIKFEDVLYRLASSGWQTIRNGAATYARPLTESQINGLARARTEEQVRSAYYGRGQAVYAASHGHSSRYCGLNLHSHFYRGTIEFRIFNSSVNPTRVQTYVALCAALVRDARNNKKRSITKAFRLGQMASGTADEKKAIFAFLQVLRYEAGLSLEDYRNLKKLWKDSRPQQRMVV